MVPQLRIVEISTTRQFRIGLRQNQEINSHPKLCLRKCQLQISTSVTVRAIETQTEGQDELLVDAVTPKPSKENQTEE